MGGVKNNVGSPEVCTQDAGVLLRSVAYVPAPLTARREAGPIRMSRRHCSGWPSARTPHRFHSTGAPRSDCHGVWSGGGPLTPVPGWGSPLCRGGQSSHICHRRGEVSSWTVSPGHHYKG